MKRRSKADGKAMKVGHRKAATPKRSLPPKAGRGRRSATNQETETARLARERDEALEREKATAAVLRLISRSASGPKPVFQAILENAVRLCEAKFGMLFLYDERQREFRAASTWNVPPAYAENLGENPIHNHPRIPMGRAAITKQPVQVVDVRAHPAYIDGFPGMVSVADLGGARTLAQVPILKESALVENFAAQAVIAIENTRLLNELRESLEQQTATSQVLSVISSSPGELEPVFQAMLENAVRICDAKFGILFRYEDEAYDPVALFGLPSALEDFLRQRRGSFQPIPGSMLDRIRQEKKLSHTADYAAEAAPGRAVTLGGARSTVDVPMLKDNELIGVISIYRQEVRPFTDKQIALLSNFAAQAVIAIENTRLLNELRESLDRQTATSQVLSVISSSSGELEPVFKTVLDNAARICEAQFGTLNTFDGSVFRAVALHNPPPPFSTRLGEVWHPHPESGLALVARTKRVVHIDDLRTRQPYLEGDKAVVDIVDRAGARTVVIVPMLDKGNLVGSISIYRQEVRPFTDKQIALVQNFAAQAVIAIENTRLLNELRQSLQQQTATADVLRVISSSPGELEPVFQAMLENATRICGAKFGTLYLCEGDGFRAAAMYNAPPAYAQARA